MNRLPRVAFLCGLTALSLGSLSAAEVWAQTVPTPANGCLTCHASLSQPALSAPAKAFPGPSAARLYVPIVTGRPDD